jgi:hypothetical protein
MTKSREASDIEKIGREDGRDLQIDLLFSLLRLTAPEALSQTDQVETMEFESSLRQEGWLILDQVCASRPDGPTSPLTRWSDFASRQFAIHFIKIDK